MDFRYIKLPSIDNKFIELPLVEINLMGIVKVLCLVDSGADFSYLHADKGESILGLNIKEGLMRKSRGVTGQEFTAYFHKLDFYIGGWKHVGSFGFSYDLGTPFGILGREDFFNISKITFKHPKRKIEIVAFTDIN